MNERLPVAPAREFYTYKSLNINFCASKFGDKLFFKRWKNGKNARTHLLNAEFNSTCVILFYFFLLKKKCEKTSRWEEAAKRGSSLFEWRVLHKVNLWHRMAIVHIRITSCAMKTLAHWCRANTKYKAFFSQPAIT